MDNVVEIGLICVSAQSACLTFQRWSPVWGPYGRGNGWGETRAKTV